MKKKLESKLAQGVRQVKSQTKPQLQSPHEQKSDAVPVGTATTSVAQGRVSVAGAGGAGATAPQPPVTTPIRRVDDLHPQRVWPD